GFTFSTPAAIGAQGNDLTSAFWGTIDEVTVYSRALGSSEIQAIYNADGAGKCSLPIPPYILAQPTNQTAFQGQGVIFSVLAGGGLPLEYQWTLDGTNIPAATSTSLTLENPTPPQGGTYSVLVSNAFGFISSSNALLTIKPSPPCVTPPAGLISWWAFESNAVDQVGGNNGVLAGHAAFGPGEAGFGLALDGNGSAVQVPAASDLRLQNFTIEAWLQRASTSAATHYATGIGFILAYGPPGFGFGLNNSGSLILTKVGVSSVTSSPIINDTLFHHVAVTKSGNIVSFYVDGVPYPASAYDPGFVFSTPVALGAQGNDLTSGFWGTLDEITIYDRALAMSEIQAIYNASASGKCNQPIAPFIIFQPTNQTVTLGGNVALSVTAGGSVPLSYQWSFNGNVIAGATASSLSLTKTSFAQQGNYSVVVTNEAGIALSTNAVLTLVYPPALIQTLGSANVPAGSTVTVPITIAANGNENAVAFSVSFDTTKMVWTGAELGVGAVGGVLIPNLSLVNSGKLGLAVALSSGQTFSPGTQQVAQITFAVAALTNTANTAIAFGDQPTPRQLLDSSLNNLAATYSGATVSITPVTGFEGDVFPRPNGDKQIEVADWLQMGRFVARLDYPANDAEFQRADCAPRATLGDGAITVSDWVQAGRYAFGLDPWTAAGGPTNAMAVAGPGPSNVRLLQEAAVQLSPGQPATASISLAAQGVENALAFSLSFDPSLVTFAGAGLGTGAQGVTVYANTNQAGAGILGFAMALATGSTFPAGTLEVLRVSFVASPSASGLLLPAFSDAPVPRGVSDAAANALPVSFETFIPSNFTPSVAITQSATNVILAWPLWATNFVLQAAAPGLPPSSQWTNVVVTPSINGNQNVLVMPITGDAKFYRLYKP
ncbi:MAG TPA: LamG-like jellyroll fold domain-containing protein, partial [Verrucomicrobiae bacterium]|nr:LamG-like jellyroll fold domain-containing protein [Verrucomicrobiae bacterium]